MTEETMASCLPPPVKVPGELNLAKMEDAAYELYDRVARADEQLTKCERSLRAELAEKSRSAQRLIAMLAAERFEFDRILRRLSPELERRGASDLLQYLNLFVRAWDLKLSRANIQVLDIAGCLLDDELAGDVEVESHVPDVSVSATMVRETLVPLVKLDGKTIGQAKIVTSVPAKKEEHAS